MGHPNQEPAREGQNIKDVTEALVEMFARVSFLDKFFTHRDPTFAAN